MAKAKRGNDQTSYRPIWERDKFWDFEEHATLQTVIENPGAAVIHIDRFFGRYTA